MTRIDEGDHRNAELLAELHQPEGLAVALGMGHPKVPHQVLFRVAPLLVPEDDDGAILEAGDAADDRAVVGEGPIAVKLEEVREEHRDVVEEVGAAGMPGELDPLPRRQA
jgi:hypothetical protein